MLHNRQDGSSSLLKQVTVTLQLYAQGKKPTKDKTFLKFFFFYQTKTNGIANKLN